MGRLRRSRVHKGIKDVSKKYRSKRKTKDLDQIQQDLVEENKLKIENAEPDADLPGMGKFYCIECNKHFVDNTSVLKHKGSKVHKRRLKQLRVPAYTQAEAEMGAGMGVGNETKISSLLEIKRQNDKKFSL
ncbi:hypothetical protein BB558_002462 [Smittium angustum]|uniref:C2H2-type domain-containing protein n=1 Tax=Smittium angustum TaxID=133377 RepID=A0A2U1J8U2_SMIAN|nr:hypothetical protein BB558_002462 [Smittium angustum]